MNGSCTRNDSGPVAHSSRGSEIDRKARTIDRVEVRTRAAGQLLARLRRRHGLLVRAGGGHHLVGVDDPRRGARRARCQCRQAVGIAGAVVALVVLGDGLPHSPSQGSSDSASCAPGPGWLRRIVHSRSVGLPGLVEDLGGDVQLADVVQEGAPAEQVLLALAQVQLVGEQFGVDPDAFGVAAGLLVVRGEVGASRARTAVAVSLASPLSTESLSCCTALRLAARP